MVFSTRPLCNALKNLKNESELTKYFIRKPLPSFPNLLAREWETETPRGGRGDLVLGGRKEQGLALVVEVKHLRANQDLMSRREKVLRQAYGYAATWKMGHRDDSVLCATLTNFDGLRIIGEMKMEQIGLFGSSDLGSSPPPTINHGRGVYPRREIIKKNFGGTTLEEHFEFFIQMNTDLAMETRIHSHEWNLENSCVSGYEYSPLLNKAYHDWFVP
mmetsp:Transcript_35905/g.78633  ORF Transcript_35905/g.78633 Transcript_35905/m.78633 type:complete len:217 (-) Transcript_35905:1344-1994(-)